MLCATWGRWDIGKRFLTGKVVKQWKRLPRAMVGSPSLEVLEKSVDLAFQDVCWWCSQVGLDELGSFF